MKSHQIVHLEHLLTPQGPKTQMFLLLNLPLCFEFERLPAFLFGTILINTTAPM